MEMTTKQRVLEGMAESTREVVLEYGFELDGLARGLALRLLVEGKRKEDACRDARVIEWTRALPGGLASDGYAPYALCHMVEQFMDHTDIRDRALLLMSQNPHGRSEQ